MNEPDENLRWLNVGVIKDDGQIISVSLELSDVSELADRLCLSRR